MTDKSGELAAMAVAIPGLHDAAKRAIDTLAAAGNVAASNGLGWRERALRVEAERDALHVVLRDARTMLVESCLTGSTALVYRIDLALDARLFDDPIPADADLGSLRDLHGHPGGDRDEPPREPDDDPAT